MTTPDVLLKLHERNDETVTFQVLKSGTPFDLTGMTLEMVLKSAASDSDDTGTVLSSTGATPAITITDAANGECEPALSATVTNLPKQNQFWRLDVLDSAGKRKTCVYGNYSIIDL